MYLFLFKREQVHSDDLCMKSTDSSNPKESETRMIGLAKPRFQRLYEKMEPMRFLNQENDGFCDHPLCIGLHT
jgi:hypothetical protein